MVSKNEKQKEKEKIIKINTSIKTINEKTTNDKQTVKAYKTKIIIVIELLMTKNRSKVATVQKILKKIHRKRDKTREKR